MMSLSQKCAQSFDWQTRIRGQAYFSSGMVSHFQVGNELITASVRGTDADAYSVELDLRDPEARRIVGRCNCPQFKKGFLCKHIWAVLLANDKNESSVDSRQPTVRVVHAGDSDLGDDELSRPQLNMYQLQAGGRPGSTTKPDRRDEMRSTGKKKKKGPPNWRKQLQAIAEKAKEEDEDGADPSAPNSRARPREIFYVLNVTASHDRNDMVAIEFFEREHRRNGEWGKIKRAAINPEHLHSLPTAEDRRLVPLLLGNQPDSRAGSAYDYGYVSDFMFHGYNRSWVRPSMYAWLLPQLAATNRFVWTLDTSLPIDEAERVVWDSGPAWRSQIRLETDEALRCWRVTGTFVRDEESLPIKQAVMIMKSGLVLFPDKLCIADFGRDLRWVLALRKGVPIEIPFSDREQFVEQLCRLPQVSTFELPETLCKEREVGRPQAHIEIATQRNMFMNDSELHAHVSFVYGTEKFRWDDEKTAYFDATSERMIVRDREYEREMALKLPTFGFTYPSNTYRFDDFNAHFVLQQKKLVEAVRALNAEGWIVETQGVRIRKPGEFTLDVKSSVDWFELDGKIDFEGVSASLPALLAALRNNEKFIRLDDGSQGLLPEDWLKKYGNLAQLAETSGDSLRFSNSQGLLLDALLAEQANVQIDEGFRAYREKLRSFTGVQVASPVDTFQGELRHYQQEGLGWLHFLRDFRFGGCLADDMGLGKTVQVLALLEARRRREIADGESRRPSIVVVPKSLVFNWMEEAARFTPNLRMLNFTGIERGERHADLGSYDVLITTYGTLRRDIVKLRRIHFDYAILDEAQAIKNAGSQAAKACRLIKADHRLAMSGTPIENHLGELWSLFDFLNPGMLGRSSAFAAMAKANAADKDALQLLSRAVRPFLLRRTKEQVLTELPEKLEQTLSCELSPSERKAYDELRDYYRVQLTNSVKTKGLAKSKIHVLEALLRLRQAACHPALLDATKMDSSSAKLEALLEQLQEVTEEGHKALVFSQFTSLLSIVRHHLDKEKIVYEYLDGQTRNRGDRVKRFQEDPNCPLFLISLKAGGHGLNLTAADYVFILDPWWNPAVEAQAVDRAHRIGQTRRVFAYRLIARGTVEDKILELQKSKKDLADAIVSANDSLIRSLTSEDLELLLS